LNQKTFKGEKKMKKLLIVCMMVIGLALGAGNGMACEGPECSAQGNFDIDTFAAGGGIDLDGRLIPNGATGGISAAGGIAGGQATGEVAEGTIGWGRWKKTIKFGDTSAALNTTGGGFTQTNSYVFSPKGFDVAIGVHTDSDNFATTQGSLDVAALGIAESHGCMFGLAGQGTLDGSIIGPSPFFGWESEGLSVGLAGQGSVGGFYGAAGSVGLGNVNVQAGIDMWGGSVTESYRGITWNGDMKTETMGTNVAAFTTVDSYGSVDRSGLAVGYVEGGYVAGGVAASKTIQANNGGVAAANALGTYSGAGELGCNFNATANGYTQTSATTMQGYNGSVMNSQAAMSVNIGPQN
jgi:hypothetical protein